MGPPITGYRVNYHGESVGYPGEALDAPALADEGRLEPIEVVLSPAFNVGRL